MLFFSNKKKFKQKKESIPFLRKPLPKKHERYSGDKKNDKRKKIPIGVFFLWSLFFVTLVYIFFFSSFVCLEKIEISGTNEISIQNIQHFIQNDISGKYFSIVPRCSLGLIQPQSLQKKLYERYPLIRTISIERIFPRTISVHIVERPYILLWDTEGGKYFVNEEGVTRNASPSIVDENTVALITLSDMSKKTILVGDKVFEPEYAHFLLTLIETFPKELNISLLPSFTIVSHFAPELRGITDEGWEIYLNTEIPLKKSLDTLKLLFAKELPQQKRQNIAYIDLRTENRVYYAFRNEGDKENISLEALNKDK